MLVFDGAKVDARGMSHVGKVRPANEDQFLVAALHKVIEVHQTSLPDNLHQQFGSSARALLLLVADGVGGAAAGELASSTTLDAVMSYVTNSMRCFYKLDEHFSHDLLEELSNVVRQSHDTVLAKAAEQPDDAGMSTTLTMAHVLWPRAYIVQIGDSRCYHLRGSQLAQVTRDQTLVQDLVDHGALAADDAERSPFSNVLTQAIGGRDTDIQPVISKVELEQGDTLLLCTDGLTKHVKSEMIGRLLSAADSSAAACERLIAAALEGGGSDNVTTVVAQFH